MIRRRPLVLLGGLWAAGFGLAFVGWLLLDDFQLRVQVSRLALLGTGICAGLAIVVRRQEVWCLLVDFFTAPLHPLSLGVFRIVIFWQISTILWIDFIALIGSLPDALQYPPETGIPAIGPLWRFARWPLHPLGPEEIALGGAALKVLCVTGMLGLFSRLSGLATAVLVFGVWGTLQWYGKVDHHHHLLWFVLLLGVSRSGDALSVDALFRAWRRARRGESAPPGPSLAYRLPIACSMLLVGVIYFFPGFWKVMVSGLDWALSDNPKHQMYLKWHMIGGWTPIVRFDQYPWLYRLGALGTLFFELTMIFWILGRRTRIAAAFAGLGFHAMTQLTMQIGFGTLRNCYVVFFDWHRIATWVGARLYPRTLVFHFAPERLGVCRAVGLARTLDVFGRVDWRETPGLGPGVVAVGGEVSRAGAAAWRSVGMRLPLSWPLLPLLFLVPSPAPAKAGPAPGGGVPSADPPDRARPWTRLVPLVVMGAFLLAGNVWTGALRMMDGWPLACYPLFDGMVRDHYDTLHIHLVQADGTERVLDAEDWRDVFGNRWNQLLRKILAEADEDRRARQLATVWRVLAERDPSIAVGTSVRFLSVRSYTDPARWEDPPEAPRLLYEAPVALADGEREGT